MIAISFLRVCMMGTIVGVGLTGCSQPSNSNNKAANSSTKSDSPATVTTSSATVIATKAPKKIAITAIVEHPSLDTIRQGVIDELAAEGYKQGENLTIDFQSAQGNPATAGQIAKQFVGENPDAIVAISTPSAQTIVANTTTIPVIYTAVSDPVAAKLIDSNNKPIQANITGLSSQLPLAPQFDFIQQIMPNAKSIGYVFSSGEANSVSLGNRLKVELPKRGLTLVDIPAVRSTDVAPATRALQGKAQMIYTSMDNNVASAFESMVLAANTMKMPIIASDEFSVRRGATAALGVNDYDFGRATGKMVGKILDGSTPAQVAPQMMSDLTLYVSPKNAQAQGITLPEDVLNKAVNVDTTPAKLPTKPL